MRLYRLQAERAELLLRIRAVDDEILRLLGVTRRIETRCQERR